jgi:hypothetical protein
MPGAESFTVDEHTSEMMCQLREMFGVRTNKAVIRKSLALASLAKRYADDDGMLLVLLPDGTRRKIDLAH